MLHGRCCTGRASGLNSLHQLHLLLFMCTVMHVSYSVCMMGIALKRAEGWEGWEVYGDDEGETTQQVGSRPFSYHLI